MQYFSNSFFANGYYQNFSWMAPVVGGFLEKIFLGGVILALVVAWSLVWKGMALWHAARRGESTWFVALLVINTLGILEILYLYVFSKKIKPVDKE